PFLVSFVRLPLRIWCFAVLACLDTFSRLSSPLPLSFFFFFTAPSPTDIYTLSLHDALPICHGYRREAAVALTSDLDERHARSLVDRKSTRLNSSHRTISYAVFCLKKKKKKKKKQK